MSTIAPHTGPAPAPVLVAAVPMGPRKRWTIAEFDDLVRKGFLREGSRTFLWDGEIIEPMPENPPHVNAAMNLVRIFIGKVPEESWTVNQGNPIELREEYKPQPDLAVLKGPRARYRKAAPVASDVALLVEVADSSYPNNAGVFMRAYAAARISQYWIVNIRERRVEVYSAPGDTSDGAPCYAQRADYGLKDAVPLVVSQDGLESRLGEVPVIDILRDSLEPDAKGAGA
jgi:Uma2 family endonuclease